MQFSPSSHRDGGSDYDVSIMDVGPRDGLQNEKRFLSVEEKVQLIEELALSGVKRIESGSFVSPKWVPQMANSLEVFETLKRLPDVEYSALTPNRKGFDQALLAKSDRIAVFSAASETFSQKNINCSIDESVARFSEVITEAKKHQIAVRGYISCVSGCPYEGMVSEEAVIKLSEKLLSLGCDEICLGDTIGVGNPKHTANLLRNLKKSVPLEYIAVHFHDTYGQALVNTYTALEEGIRIIDSSVAGLGGCPYAKGASGNVSTEDVVYMLNGLGLKTGINLKQLCQAGKSISEKLGIPYRSQAGIALTS